MTNSVVAQALDAEEGRRFTSLELAHIRRMAEQQIADEDFREAVEREKDRIRRSRSFWRRLRALFPLYFALIIERPRS